MSGDLADTLRSVSLVEPSWQKDFMSLWQNESCNLISSRALRSIIPLNVIYQNKFRIGLITMRLRCKWGKKTFSEPVDIFCRSYSTGHNYRSLDICTQTLGLASFDRVNCNCDVEKLPAVSELIERRCKERHLSFR